MVTKNELEAEAKREIEDFKQKLLEAQEKHKSFEAEDKAEEKYEKELTRLHDLEDKIISEKWKGNWENRDNWYHSSIPVKFKKFAPDYSHEKDIFAKVLTEISEEKEKKIVKSKEYIEFEKQKKNLERPEKSKEHVEAEDNVERFGHALSWWTRRLDELNDRGKFIEICKREKKIQKNREDEKETMSLKQSS